MSFFKKLFGGGASESGISAVHSEVEHEGYLIRAMPVKEAGGQYRIAGTISREVDGQIKEHRLIRADLFTSADDAADAMIRKAKQVIKEQGNRIFG
jgi:hypothetical protein